MQTLVSTYAHWGSVTMRCPSSHGSFVTVIFPPDMASSINISSTFDGEPTINLVRISRVPDVLGYTVLYHKNNRVEGVATTNAIYTPDQTKQPPTAPPPPPQKKNPVARAILPRPAPTSPTVHQYNRQKWYLNATQRCVACKDSLAKHGLACGHTNWCMCHICFENIKGEMDFDKTLKYMPCLVCQQTLQYEAAPLIPMIERENAIMNMIKTPKDVYSK